MKNFIIFIFAVASLQAFSAELDCAKGSSKITLDKKNVNIEADAVMTDELVALVQRTTGSAEGNSKVSVKISFPKKDLKCTDALPKVFNCSGSTKKASVEINVSQQSMFGSSSMQLMQRPVKIESIDIASSVASQGPIILGSDSTTVQLDGVTVTSSMFVKMKGDFKLELSQSFAGLTECK